jgi:hypothetical protein
MIPALNRRRTAWPPPGRSSPIRRGAAQCSPPVVRFSVRLVARDSPSHGAEQLQVSHWSLRDFILTHHPTAARSCDCRPDGSTECPSPRGDGVLIWCVSPSPPGTSQMARGFISPATKRNAGATQCRRLHRFPWSGYVAPPARIQRRGSRAIPGGLRPGRQLVLSRYRRPAAPVIARSAMARAISSSTGSPTRIR